MTGPAARGLPVAEHDLDHNLVRLGWRPVAVGGIRVDWPPAEHVTAAAAWTSGGTVLVLMDDDFIQRRYLRSDDPDGSSGLHRLVSAGLVRRPSVLFAAARGRAGWAESGDTLYDVVAGCIDSDDPEVVEIWRRRLSDLHPLVRLAASWAGPYLSAGEVVEALARTAEHDEDPQVRAAAAASVQVIQGRVADGQPRSTPPASGGSGSPPG